MSGIGDQGMMPEYVQPQHPDDDSMEEDGETETVVTGGDEQGQAEVDDALAGISDGERADAAGVPPGRGPVADPADRGEL